MTDKQRSKERYAYVKAFSPTLYSNIAAFASTVDLSADDARAKIEDYCMALVKQVDTWHDGDAP